jgi:tetratricopeptide (TPR) repeat protein
MTKESEKTGEQKHDELLDRMKAAKEQWDQDDGEAQDDTDRLLSEAMELAIQQGKGWAPGEKEEYMKKIMDDDFIPPIFASTTEEVEQSGLSDAFSSLLYDETPTQLMLTAKKKGNDAFADGKRNQVQNVQFYRDAINHYYEAFAWSRKVEPVDKRDETRATETQDPTFTEEELNEFKSTLCANTAMAHMQLKNWGFVREESSKALQFNPNNVKAWYRLAKAHQMLKNWEQAGDAVESGLKVDKENKELLKLEKILEKKVQKARRDRQLRERARAERVVKVKDVWKHCKTSGIQLGRVPLVATVSDEEDEGDEAEESRWNSHFPHTGRLPSKLSNEQWSWPSMFVYPSHSQSDFVEAFGESELLALRMAEMFPELEDSGDETAVPWDYNNEFICSSLAVYFEVHCTESKNKAIHPDSVEPIEDQGSAMRFYEASRALKGDEGPEMQNIARIAERQHLHKQRKKWKKQHGSLRVKPDPCAVVRVHPAVTLLEVLTDRRMVVPNYLVTFIVFPENHPAHQAFLKEHKCIGILQPKGMK